MRAWGSSGHRNTALAVWVSKGLIETAGVPHTVRGMHDTSGEDIEAQEHRRTLKTVSIAIEKDYQIADVRRSKPRTSVDNLPMEAMWLAAFTQSS